MTTPVTIRAFIAIDLEATVRKALLQARNDLEKRLATNAVRWVRLENIHLTLRFLGETPSAKVSHLAEAMDRVGANFRPFELTLDELGCFPHPRKPRVVWIGLKGERSILFELQQALTEELFSLGWHPEKRRYHPHLTLGRVKNHQSVTDSQLPWGKPVKSANLSVDSLCLFESKLKQFGPVYSIHHTTRL